MSEKVGIQQRLTMLTLATIREVLLSTEFQKAVDIRVDARIKQLIDAGVLVVRCDAA